MPRGAKGQRDLLEKIQAISKANPGISAADLYKKAEADMVAEGILKPSAELPEELKADMAKLVEWCTTNKKQIHIAKGEAKIKSSHPRDPNKPTKPSAPKAPKAPKAAK